MPPSTTLTARPLSDAPQSKSLLVVGLCAAWCNTCGDFEHAFDAMASSRPDAAFAWIDIEDDADLVGDVDVENFPTIAVFRDGRLVHFGTSLPQPAVVARLLESLDAASRTVAADPGIAELPTRLARLEPDRAGRILRGR